MPGGLYDIGACMFAIRIRADANGRDLCRVAARQGKRSKAQCRRNDFSHNAPPISPNACNLLREALYFSTRLLPQRCECSSASGFQLISVRPCIHLRPSSPADPAVHARSVAGCRTLTCSGSPQMPGADIALRARGVRSMRIGLRSAGISSVYG